MTRGPGTGLMGGGPVDTSGAAAPEEVRTMGQPVVHFEILGRDPVALAAFYRAMFGWEADTANPLSYGVIAREDNLGDGGVGIGGGIGRSPEGHPGHVTVYVAVPDVEAALARAEVMGGTRTMGPEPVVEGVEIGLFTDPEGHLIGVLRG